MIQSMKFAKQLLQGICFLHSRNIYHRDLKPDNIFIFKDQNQELVLRIGDFNISKIVEEDYKDTFVNI